MITYILQYDYTKHYDHTMFDYDHIHVTLQSFTHYIMIIYMLHCDDTHITL